MGQTKIRLTKRNIKSLAELEVLVFTLIYFMSRKSGRKRELDNKKGEE